MGCMVFLGFLKDFFSVIYLFIYFNWRLITLQYFGGFCHTFTWISHGCTCVPHPELPFHLPHHPIPQVHPCAWQRINPQNIQATPSFFFFFLSILKPIWFSLAHGPFLFSKPAMAGLVLLIMHHLKLTLLVPSSAFWDPVTTLDPSI